MKTLFIVQLIILILSITNLNAQSEGKYYIESEFEDKYLDVELHTSKNGTPLNLSRGSNGITQRFNLEDAGNGYFYIKSDLEKYVHIENNSSNSNAKVVLWEGKGDTNTKWKFHDIGDGYYSIQSKKGTYMINQWGKRTDGTRIVMWKRYGSAWKLKTIEKGEKVNQLIRIRVSNMSFESFHNNDCSRLQGSLIVRIKNIDNSEYYNPTKNTLAPSVNYVGDYNSNLLLFNGTLNKDYHKRNINKLNNYAHNVDFIVNLNDYISGKLQLELFSSIWGCHKTCDLCSGYHCKVRYNEIRFISGYARRSTTLKMKPHSSSNFVIKAQDGHQIKGKISMTNLN
ncbi:hypothetical protein ATO12_24905 [Aquimarina atlantica]|uniref:Ricin B lectin domain-containing protein n=1 Tax=Aquimarina atlantica TaxID=1317122 RepID=A0A023BQA9_9FLAO|nr:RICIN domain-containing protein [Aquimarina atlantica]EZH72176.1 hypothetical protein ATO12_24905 [Aquimarina atlantica]